MIKITNRWTYRLGTTESKLGVSLQVYSQKKNDWMHMCFFNPVKLAAATVRYNETASRIGFTKAYTDFTFNNLLELATITHFVPNEEVESMLDDICEILDIELKVL